jgi:hypothetical protein
MWLPTHVQCYYPHMCNVITHTCVMWLPTQVQCYYPHMCNVITHTCAMWLPTHVNGFKWTLTFTFSLSLSGHVNSKVEQN